MSRTTSYWRTLKLSSKESQTPPLLVKYEFGPLHYNIYLSDLTHIWTESLERREIVKRALNVDTSIDPSESSDQLQLLLQNVQKALDGVKDATLSLSISGISQQLILRTTTPLPGALKPLVWPFHLVAAPQHLLTAELLQPCLSQIFFAKAQVVSLIQLIKDKDHVITRLTEKMQSDGTDLSKVFPGASGLRTGAKSHFRESASKFVKGLGEFNDERWRRCFRDSTQLPSNLPDIFSQVFSSDLEILPEFVIKDVGGAWWQNLRNEESQKLNALDSSNFNNFQKPQSSTHPSRDVENGGMNDAGFQGNVSGHVSKRAQVQIPPSKTYSTDAPSDKILQSESYDGDTTTDDSDGDLKPGMLTDDARKNTVQKSPDTLSRSSSSKDAGFGKFKGEDPSNYKIKLEIPVGDLEKPNQANLEKKNEVNRKSRVTSPESDGIDDVPVPQSKSRLGKIGGRSTPIKASNPSERKDLHETKSLPSRERGSSSALDAEDKTGFSLPSNPDLLSKEKASLPRKSPSPQRKTSQERADHRREQLKRNLESTAANTTKKKRKF